ncbi:carbohydrate esterase family 8 protein [Phaffia rhodozyma]|uniref:Pectinesterase n=1 Tax=Phaffia rhodozyma TaxID=264483 RepID=A0A0F7SRM8_PHARH|nr:carbohydrate esterase family 8 protein [Phaffia rhodozyma]
MRFRGLTVVISCVALVQALPTLITGRNHKWDRTSPEEGDLVVGSNHFEMEYKTISEALAALGPTGGNVFVYPGVYHEQVVLNKTGPIKIQGYTSDARDYKNNQVVITYGLDAVSVNKSNDLSGTVRAESAGVNLYNLDIENTYGKCTHLSDNVVMHTFTLVFIALLDSSFKGHYTAGCQCQAIALSAQAGKQGYYGVKLTGYQDTLLANIGTQIYSKSCIAGAVDFIFGQNASVYIYKSDIVSTAEGNITAPGGTDENAHQVFVFHKSNIIPAYDAATNVTGNGTGNVFLGRPWKAFGKTIYRNSYIGDHVNPVGWKIWNVATPNVNQSTLAEYKNYGPGSYYANRAERASFAQELTQSEAENYTITAVLGLDYESWVDLDYV